MIGSQGAWLAASAGVGNSSLPISSRPGAILCGLYADVSGAACRTWMASMPHTRTKFNLVAYCHPSGTASGFPKAGPTPTTLHPHDRPQQLMEVQRREGTICPVSLKSSAALFTSQGRKKGGFRFSLAPRGNRYNISLVSKAGTQQHTAHESPSSNPRSVGNPGPGTRATNVPARCR
jgi:hypothetical protein